MKSDRAGRSGAILLVLTGLWALVVGCASLSSQPEDDRGSEQPAFPDPPLEIVGEPERSVPAGDVTHLPDTSRLDPQWRTSLPEVPTVPDESVRERPTAAPAAILEPPAVPGPVVGPALSRLGADDLSRSHVSGLMSLPVPSPPAAFQEQPQVVLLPPPARSLVEGAEAEDAVDAAEAAESGERTEAAEATEAVDPVERAAVAERGSPVATLDDAALPERPDVAAGETLPPGGAAPAERGDPTDDGHSTSEESATAPASRSAAASARSTQPSNPAATASRPPREDTSGERRVDPGQPFEVALPGRGWVYLGGGDELQFLDRTTQEGDVVFSFRGPAADTGSTEPTTLEFESQDLATGRRTRHEERVLVAEGGDSASAGDGRQPEGNAAGEDADAAGAGGASEEEAAAVGAGGVPTDLAQADYAELLARVDDLEAAGDHQGAVDLLEAMRREGMGRDDELIMRLAQLYESEWSGRDLPHARELYHRVVDNYPLSRWRGPARERIEYLNRHFFHIR
ncbi:MAG: hypothetical protein R6U25_12265 [Alkalispirochaeta sp.]